MDQSARLRGSGCAVGFGDLDEDPVGCAQVEDWGCPLRLAGCQNSPEGLADGYVDRPAVGNRLVQGPAEGDGSVVANLELQGNNSRNALVDEAGRGLPRMGRPY